MTDAEFLEWLKGSAYRVTLVEVDLSESETRYLSNVPYTTLPDDTPANLVYQPFVGGGFAYTTKMSLTGNANISIGSIDLENQDGALNTWTDDVWVNRAVRVYIGDIRWPHADFRQVFDGIISELDFSRLGTLSIVLRNKLERLNTTVTEEKLGGSTPNADRLLPVCLGENHNVTPLLVDPAEHEYQWHNGPAERLIEVRDNGVPVDKTTFLSTGKFRLTANPFGQITASVQGYTPYTNTVAGLVRILATEYGSPTERLTVGDLDTVNLAAFEIECPQPVGINFSERANVLQSCQELAASVGAQVVMNSLGKLQIIRLKLPGSGTPVNIGMSDYEFGTISVREQPDVIAGVKLGFCKNWSPQQPLENSIPAEHWSLYAQEWLTVSAFDAFVGAEYRLFGTAPQENTLLLTREDAQAEADRRLALWKEQRAVYRVKGYPQLMLLELGQAVTLTSDRYGLDEGKQGVVVGLDIDWINCRASVEVLI